jgi:hypothetical protein
MPHGVQHAATLDYTMLQHEGAAWCNRRLQSMFQH